MDFWRNVCIKTFYLHTNKKLFINLRRRLMSYQTISNNPGQPGGFFSKIFGGNGDSSLMKSSANLLACLDSAQANLLFADTNFTLVHANEKSVQTLQTIGTEIQQEFRVRIDEIVGGSIHRFHKDPSRIERILKNPSGLPHIGEFTFAGITLSACVNAIYDRNRQVIGYVVNWENVTEKKKTEVAMEQAMSMLEHSRSNVMFADMEFNITYINPASIKTLKTIEQYLPVNAEEILGKSVDIFHKNPDHQRRILSDPSNLPMDTDIQVGPETLDLLATAIFDENKNRLGTMLSWDVVTQARANQAEIGRIKSMMDNIPINVMMCDLDTFQINYLNPESLKTLKTIEQHLPVKTEELQGLCIDVLHKNPSHQRKILSDPKNLPHNAQIQVGPEILDLLVSPIYDDSKNYLGPMVTWSVITQKLEMEKNEREQTESMQSAMEEVASVVQTLGASSEELSSVSDVMSQHSQETANMASQVSDSANEISNSVQTVATGTEEMSASIKEIATNSSEAAKVTADAVQGAEKAGQIISKLGESSQEIGDVIKVITSIAEQTNLLALNATIEAARAGEAGKGFAVVANEVKELANQTGKATEDISNKIQAIQGDSSEAVSAIAEVGDIVNRINDISTSIASMVEEQTATTNEMSRNVQEAATGSIQIAEKTAEVAKAAVSTKQGADDTGTSARELSKMSMDLQAVVDRNQQGGGTSNKKSLFDRIGGKGAVDAAVGVFYEKVMTDFSLKPFFDGVDMNRQKGKMKIFLTYAFGGTPNYSGKSMRDAHKHLVQKGMNESHFNKVMEHLGNTLKELNVPGNLIQEAAAIALSTKNDVLNR
jgi:methyl-accepting chemotaxis protein